MNVASTPVSPAALRAYVASLPPGPPTPGLVELQQRSLASSPDGVAADPLAAPGGSAEELAWQDRQRTLRQQLKVLLAGSKLHAGLTAAALGYADEPARAGASSDPAAVADQVARYVERATAWIEATTRELERRWLGADAGLTEATSALSGYHRYELARLLVALLQRQPQRVDQTDPTLLATCLAAPGQTLPAAPPVPAWVSAGAAADVRMAWSRALARVLETAVDHPFNRELDVVLDDARAAIAGAVDRQMQPLAEALAYSPDARRVAELHALKIAGQLYAATLIHVHQESTRMIQSYQDLLEQGRLEAADRLAQIYQERQLGYVGVPQHFQRIVAVHERQQERALAALAASNAIVDPVAVSPAAEPPATTPTDRAGGAVRTTAPAP